MRRRARTTTRSSLFGAAFLASLRTDVLLAELVIEDLSRRILLRAAVRLAREEIRVRVGEELMLFIPADHEPVEDRRVVAGDDRQLQLAEWNSIESLHHGDVPEPLDERAPDVEPATRGLLESELESQNAGGLIE